MHEIDHTYAILFCMNARDPKGEDSNTKGSQGTKCKKEKQKGRSTSDPRGGEESQVNKLLLALHANNMPERGEVGQFNPMINPGHDHVQMSFAWA